MEQQEVKITEEELWRGLNKLEEQLSLLKKSGSEEESDAHEKKEDEARAAAVAPKGDKPPKKEEEAEEDDTEKSLEAAEEIVAKSEQEDATGIEVSDFLMELVQTFRKGMDDYKDHIVDMVKSNHEATEEIVKSIAGYTRDSQETLCKSADAINSAWDMPARGPKSVVGSDGTSPQGKAMTPLQQVEFRQSRAAKLKTMVKGGEATMLDLVRYEKSGELSDELAKSLN